MPGDILPRFTPASSKPLAVNFCLSYCYKARFFIIAFSALLLISFTLLWKQQPQSPAFSLQSYIPGLRSSHAPPLHDLPPLYSEYHNAELRLPQQNWSSVHPDEHEKFFFVAGHYRKGLGWGNIIQEHLLNAYLAFRAGRSLVFDNYTWASGTLYSDWNGHKIPAQIPLTAIVRGPIVGDPFPFGVEAPLAVTKVYFDHLCPKKLQLHRGDVHSRLPPRPPVSQIIDAWVQALRATDNPCVQESTKARPGPIFDHDDIWGVPGALLDIWPLFSSSPIMTEYRWSPLVELGFDTNRDLFLPPESLADPLLSSSSVTLSAPRYSPIPGLLVIHVRAGDFALHCALLGDASQPFVGANTFPELPDQFVVPVDHVVGTLSSPEHHEVYRKRCFPSTEEIVQKVMDVRGTPEGRGINKIFVMTNMKPPGLDVLRDALWSAGEWEMVATSRDMVLNWEQKSIAQAIDQLAAQRAQVFIGNGFSTLTSHVMMLRVANGFPPGTNRLW